LIRIGGGITSCSGTDGWGFVLETLSPGAGVAGGSPPPGRPDHDRELIDSAIQTPENKAFQ
jgi:hypothetical protein